VQLTEAGVLRRHVFGRKKLLRDGRFADTRSAEHQYAVHLVVNAVVHAITALRLRSVGGLKAYARATRNKNRSTIIAIMTPSHPMGALQFRMDL